MDFAAINHIAVIVATVVAFAIGSGYYALLGKAWMAAARIDPGSAQPNAGFLLVTIVAELVMAIFLAGIISHFESQAITVWMGIACSLCVWLGFIVTTMAVNHRYQGFGWDLTVIDAGHWLLVAIAMGAVIGGFGG